MQFTDRNFTSVKHDTAAVRAMWCVRVTTLFISWAEFGGRLFIWPGFCYSESTKNVNKPGGSHWSAGGERKQEKDIKAECRGDSHRDRQKWWRPDKKQDGVCPNKSLTLGLLFGNHVTARMGTVAKLNREFNVSPTLTSTVKLLYHCRNVN